MSSSRLTISSSFIDRWGRRRRQQQQQQEEVYEFVHVVETNREDEADDHGGDGDSSNDDQQHQTQHEHSAKRKNTNSSSTTAKKGSTTKSYYNLHGLHLPAAETGHGESFGSATTSVTIRRWSDFCSSVFSYKKPNPPSSDYFYRHYMNDPDRTSPCLIRVATVRMRSGQGGEGRDGNDGGSGDDHDDDNDVDDSTHNDDQIVASVRIFLRRLSVPNNCTSQPSPMQTSSPSSFIWAGGIGEVCTHEDHRRRGLSRRLLETAIQMMRDIPQLQVGILHAGPAFQQVYEKVGFVPTTTQWSTICIRNLFKPLTSRDDVDHVTTALSTPTSRKTRLTTSYSLSVREAEFPNDTTHLMKLHREYSERRLSGCIVRTEEYWNDYLSVELDKSLFVLVMEEAGNGDDPQEQDGDNTTHGQESDQHNNDITNQSLPTTATNRIIAWLSVRPRGDNCYQLHEFGIDINTCGGGGGGGGDGGVGGFDRVNNSNKMTTFGAMSRLLAHALNCHDKERLTTSSDHDSSSDMISVMIPQFVLDEMKSQSADIAEGGENDVQSPNRVGWEEVTAASDDMLTDRGWMYLNLSNSPETTDYLRSVQSNSSPYHMIWPSDSF